MNHRGASLFAPLSRRGEALLATLLALLVAVLTAAAAALPDMPAGLGPGWLAAGLLVGPLVRWPWRLALPMAAIALLTGLALGERLNAHQGADAAIVLAQCAFVAARLRAALPLLHADRRPLYRVRLAHLSRFLFAITLPAALAGGVLVATTDALTSDLPLHILRATGLTHAAATGLSIAVLAPLMWWDQMRAVPWRVALVAAAVGLMLLVLAAVEGRLFWLVPVVVLLAGHFGSVWTVTVTVTCIATVLLLQSRAGMLAAFDGPQGFMVWLLVVWRLLAAGFAAALWSERRSGLHRRSDSGGSVAATAAAAANRWTSRTLHQGDWLLVPLSTLLPPTEIAASHRLAPGSSLRARTILTRLAARVREGDMVVGLGDNRAWLLLHLTEARAPRTEELRSRCRSVTHEGLDLGRTLRLDAAAVGLLLTSAVWLEDDAPHDEAPAAPPPWPVPGPVVFRPTA